MTPPKAPYSQPTTAEKYEHAALIAATMSQEPRTQVGAVVVSGDRWVFGYNHTTTSAENPVHIHKKDRGRLIHAEEHALTQAQDLIAHSEHPIHMYCTWACCEHCADLIIQAGVERVFTNKLALEATPDRWFESVTRGCHKLITAGVDLVIGDWRPHPLYSYPRIKMDEKMIQLFPMF